MMRPHLFYRRLFEIDLSRQQMFKGDMADQRRKLMHVPEDVGGCRHRVIV
jgi:hypothetical protein